MKKLLLPFWCLFFVLLSIQSQTKEQSVYIDFGKDNVNDGNATLSPDNNGNHWNNAIETALGSTLNLINSENTGTGFTLQITKSFLANGIQNGGLLSSDPDLLGDFAVNTATQDYFYADGHGSFTIKNLDKNKAYKFHVFGSRLDASKQRIGYLSFNGSTGSHGIHQMGGPGIGLGEDPTVANNNNSTIFETDYVFPDHKGEIHFHMVTKSGDYSHINIMKIEEYSDVVKMDVKQKFYIDFGRNNGTDGNITSGRDVNGNYWNNMSGEGSAPAGSKISLVTSANKQTTIEMELITAFSSNGIKSGALLEPDAALLNDLAIATATQDYFFSAAETAIEFKNLNKTKTYRFHVFGSRFDAGAHRLGLFTFTGANTCTGIHKMGGPGFGVTGANTNDCEVLVSELISPDANNVIRLDMQRNSGAFLHINAIKIEECSNTPVLKTSALYIDFGKDNITDGNATVSPDNNGNYWNNALETTLGSTLQLISASNINTGYTLEITKGFAANGIQNGGLLNADPDLLGDLAVNTATQDYFYVNGATGNGSFKIKNLNKEKAYKFYIFGSRSDDANARIGYFSFGGSTGFHGTHQMGGPGIGTNGSDNNNSTIFETDYIYPDHKGEIHFHMGVKSGGFSHINAMKIEEFTGVEKMHVWQKFYIDLGRNNVDDGNNTTGADVNGNYWNNAFGQAETEIAGGNKITLFNSFNNSSDIEMELMTLVRSNGIRNGGLLAPEAALLNDLAIVTATQDYIYIENANSGTIDFKNMNPAKGYRFFAFGSRTDTADRMGLITVSGLNSSTGLHKMGGTNFGGTGVNQNNSDVYVSEIIYPDNDGKIRFDMTRYAGTFAHLNIIKIEECDEAPFVKVTSATVSGNDITLSGKTSQLSAEISPANAFCQGVSWSVNDASTAYISNNGVLYPKKNGTVTVTATFFSGENIITATKEINISGQLGTIYFTGSAAENSEDSSMKMLSNTEGIITNNFELYTSISSGSFYFYRTIDNNTVRYGAGDEEGTLAVDGNEINTTLEGTVRISVDLENMTYAILPITSLYIVGTSTPTGTDVTGGLALTYQGEGIWSNRLTLNGGDPNFYFVINKTANESFKRVSGTNEIIYVPQGKEFGTAMENIRTNMNGGEFDISINLQNYTYSVSCASVSNYKISYMGSSVCRGVGAPNEQGYTYMYTQLLKTRYNTGMGMNWTTSNISIGGNSTTNLLNRWERDLLSDCSRYVLYGLSLGNEGIHEKGEPAYISYRDGMLQAIAQAKDAGIIPVIANNYTRGDFNESDYNYVKQLNMLIHEWELPSINTLGAIDNGAGQWASGYQSDNAHPNSAGHIEFLYAMVPSLFDALEAGKPLPQRVSGTLYDLSAEKVIEFTPEHTVHPFTLSFDVKTANAGTIASFNEKTGTGYLKINSEGKLVYESPVTGSIVSSTTLPTDAWFKVTLTHYYAWGVTFLYINDTKEGMLNEKLVPKKFILGGCDASQYRELFFWRAGMNAEEIAALNQGKMLKSSLEIYAPLSENNPLENLAQSTNTLQFKSITSTLPDETGTQLNLYPNPVNRGETVNVNANGILKIHTIQGALVYEQKINDIDVISTKILIPGYYVVSVNNNTYAKLIVK